MPNVSELISQILLKKLREEALTPQEEAVLAEWEGRSPEHAEFIAMLINEASLSDKIKNMLESDERSSWQRIERALAAEWNERAVPQKRKYSWFTYAAAASVVTLLGFGIYYVSNTSKATKPTTKADIVPGGNRADLILADGSVIKLNEKPVGEVATQGGNKITKTEEGKLVYDTSYKFLEAPPLQNLLTTPLGGRYQLMLPDGSKVWLNAGSTIKYPVFFTNMPERKVEISGEAYFEVSKQHQKKFTVVVNNANGRRRGEVEVLGTHFNIKAYDNEGTVATTLMEGSVKVTGFGTNAAKGDQIVDSKSIVPGQQVLLNENGQLEVKKNVSLESVMAWTGSTFIFQNDDIGTILRQAARWYNVKIAIEGNIPQITFTATISRNKNLSELLTLLEPNGYHFRMKGDTLVVSP
jgi:transmembrane sensor